MNTNTLVNLTTSLTTFHQRIPRREWPPPKAPGRVVAQGSDQP